MVIKEQYIRQFLSGSKTISGNAMSESRLKNATSGNIMGMPADSFMKSISVSSGRKSSGRKKPKVSKSKKTKGK